jgi:hypothetical protein
VGVRDAFFVAHVQDVALRGDSDRNWLSDLVT